LNNTGLVFLNGFLGFFYAFLPMLTPSFPTFLPTTTPFFPATFPTLTPFSPTIFPESAVFFAASLVLSFNFLN
jgi:hypothetical protein